MSYQAILFDMDGTLLPMDNDEFTRTYFGLLIKAVSCHGYTGETLIPAMWKGVEAMVKNDGTENNETRFWQVFSKIFGEEAYGHIPTFDNFYHTDFHKAKAATQPTELSKKAVALAHKKAERVVVATTPLFPACAIEARLSWVDLYPEDFDLVTTYENSHFCKPNPKYYLEICEKLGLDPKKCLMVGNNTKEDVWAASQAGMDTYLVTDCLIVEGDMPDCKKGSLKELCDFLETV